MLHKCYGEVLPYLEVKKHETEQEITEIIEMPNVIGMTVEEAKKTLNELGVEVVINGEITEESIVIDQLPKKGIQVNVGTKVSVYIE